MKSISPVIATVIIVAVAIAISIAVALWLTGIVGGFTTVENLQITYAYASKDAQTNEWWVTLKVENKGTATATIDEIFVNGVPVVRDNVNYTFDETTNETFGTNGIPLSPGKGVTIYMKLTGSGYTAGQQVEIKLHTASGKEYPKMVNLP